MCSAYLLNIYRNRHRIDVSAGLDDPAVAQGISDLLDPTAPQLKIAPLYAQPGQTEATPDSDDDEREYNEYHDFKWNTAGQEQVRAISKNLCILDLLRH
jgi:hypothetical protein